MFGRQQLLLISLLFFSVGAALCAVAEDFTFFISGRSVQGIGGGGIITMGQIIFSDIVPLRQRPKYFAMVLGAWAIGKSLNLGASSPLTSRLRLNPWAGNGWNIRAIPELALGILP